VPHMPNSNKALKIRLHEPYNNWTRTCLAGFVQSWVAVGTYRVTKGVR